ncbi:MAG TPA: GTP 3',8-cyclase MoaA [Bryobacteraceae bacterium]|nr:GTP 3',8-cyclase MoaA [Bryobacteraceae bacterium]
MDTFGRVHSDLRISVTDRCNIRCFYCMPEEGAEFTPVSRLLNFEQIGRFVKTAASVGFRKIRLTGGEPLLRPRLPELIEQLTAIDGIEDLALTTNAVLLEKHAAALYAAGLRRLNVHLDTLDRARFERISRRDELPRVLAGIEAARAAGFKKIKLNAVAMKGITEGDLVPLVRYGRERGMEVRFIEFMPLDAQRIWSLDQVLTADEMLRRLAAEFGPLEAVPDADPRAPATEYRFSNGDRIGLIASVSKPFCMNCNRLRLTSDGKLRYCLFAREESDIRQLLEEGDESALEAAIRRNIQGKWPGHQIGQASFIAPQRPMYSIGG